MHELLHTQMVKFNCDLLKTLLVLLRELPLIVVTIVYSLFDVEMVDWHDLLEVK